jgi:hypothetical protein
MEIQKKNGCTGIKTVKEKMMFIMDNERGTLQLLQVYGNAIFFNYFFRSLVPAVFCL